MDTWWVVANTTSSGVNSSIVLLSCMSVKWTGYIFAKFRKATVSFVVSVCPSVRPSVCMEKLGSHWTVFFKIKFDIWVFFENLFRKFQLHQNPIRITSTLHEDPYTFCSYPSVHHRVTSVSDKSLKNFKIKTPILCSITFFPKIMPFIRVRFIHSVFCLTKGPKPPPKRFLHVVRYRASSFKWKYPLLSLRLPNSFLRLLPRLVTSISPFVFPSITCFRRQFLRKMWPIQLAYHFLISCRIILCSLTLNLLWDNVKKYSRARQVTRQYGACALHAAHLSLQTPFQSM